MSTRSARVLAAVRSVGIARTNMLFIVGAYLVLGLSLICQPARWAATPAYHNLLELMPQQAWGALFAVLAVLLACAAWRHGTRWLTRAALTAGIAVTTFWCAAFIVRWATSANTTPETWVSFASFDYLLLRTLMLPRGGSRADGRGSRA